mgnify:CR=1 FL=1
MNENKLIEERALKTSMVGALLLAIWGIVMANITSSGAIMLDGMFNLISAVLSFFSIYITRLIAEKATKEYPLGYFAFETLFVLIKGSSILILIVLSVSVSLNVLLKGGREPELGLMIVYVAIAIVTCLAMYLLLRRSFKKAGTDILDAETQSWLIKCVVTGAIGLAGVVVMLIQGTSLGWIARYIDQILVIAFSLIFLKDPILLIKSGLKELLLAAPQQEYTRPFELKLLPMKEQLDLKSLKLEVLKTGRRVWGTIFVDPEQDTINVNEFMKAKKDLARLVREVYEDSQTEVILERAS